MDTIVCTLFEGHHHYGVAALVNSLYRNGFRGTVYAGYKGDLPVWPTNLQKVSFLKKNALSMQVAEGLQIIFVPLTTEYHLTNYKPDFLLDVCEHHKYDVSGIFYFDPDILLIQEWVNMEKWIKCGVAVSEDVNSPLQEFHPRRCAWRKYFNTYGIHLQFKHSIYVNGGFLGVSNSDIDFLLLWKKIQEAMAQEIGGLSKSIFKNDIGLSTRVSNDFDPFGKTDQDALNAALEAYTKPVSYGGKEVMGFENGLLIIPHALGQNKPWMINPIRDWLRGGKPRRVDKLFWNYVNGPITIYPNWIIEKKTFAIRLSSFLSRFYSR